MTDEWLLGQLAEVRRAMEDDFTGPNGEITDELAALDAVIAELRQRQEPAMQKTITLTPAYDRRNPDPAKNYGQHGVDLWFVLRGPKGAITFRLFTDWLLPHVAKELKAKGHRPLSDWEPEVAGVTFHSLGPRPNNEAVPQGPCEWLGGQPCHSHMSSVIHEKEIAARLLKEGSDGVWAALEDYYREVFGE